MIGEESNVIKLPQSLHTQKGLIEEALALGVLRAKVIETKSIALGSWVKLHCQYGCSYYGKLHTCPPCSPTSYEMAEILTEYEKALLVYGHPESNIREVTVELEESFKQKGFYKAFALCSRPCDLCEVCTINTHCLYPEKARPTLQACGVNLHQTFFDNGWGDSGPAKPCAENPNIGLVLLD